MTHYILFWIMILIGFAYSIKYGKKAEADINAFNKEKEKDLTDTDKKG